MRCERTVDKMATLRELQRELAEIKDQMITREDLLTLSHQLSSEIQELTRHQERIQLDAQHVRKELVSLVKRTGLLKNEAYSTRERFTTIELKIESFCREWTESADHF